MPNAEHAAVPLVVFCHLRWDFVYQRPQHLLSRIAKHRRVVVIEEPVADAAGAARWERSMPEPNVLVCRPRTPSRAAGFGGEQLPSLTNLLGALAAEEGLHGAVAWLYTPLALSLAETLDPSIVVYDCMDELSLFLNAPPDLPEREAELMARADVMFAGGRSLYRAKHDRHANIFCFPSSVDALHFRQAAGPEPVVADAPDQATLPHPRLGFYGVIDERLDLSIVDALARAHPEWQIVMVGPVVKIDPATLPRHPNLLWTGQRRYDELPAYLAGWDVCLLPFALNDATRFISPTKTLEYMAAERPIVSTPITDVAESYGDVVALARTPADFVAACEASLAETDVERTRRIGHMRAILAHTSWDATATSMQHLVAKAHARRQAVA